MPATSAEFGKLREFIFGPNDGGLTWQELDQATYSPKFSKYLPWRSYSEKNNCFYNKDGSVGLAYECQPLYFAGEADILEGLFRLNLPEWSVIQFILFSDPYIEPFLDQYKGLKVRQNPLMLELRDYNIKFLRRCAEEGMDFMDGMALKHYRLFVTLKVPGGPWADDERMADIHRSVKNKLRTAKLFPEPLHPEQLLSTMRRLFNDKENLPRNPAEWDRTRPLHKQVIYGTPIETQAAHLKIGRKTVKCLTPKKNPEFISSFKTTQLFGGVWGIGSDTEQIKTPYLYALSAVVRNMTPELRRKCEWVMTQQTIASFASSLQESKMEFAWAMKKINDGEKFFSVIPSFILYSDDERKLDDSVEMVKTLWEKQGFTMHEDKWVVDILFIMTLPFGLYTGSDGGLVAQALRMATLGLYRGGTGEIVENLERDIPMPIDALTAFLPITGDYMGRGKPQYISSGRRGGLVTLDLFRGKNYNFYVVAAPGSGKSVFVCLLLLQYYLAGCEVRVCDVGKSYKKLAHVLKQSGERARFMDFDENSRISMNPFVIVVDPKEDLPLVEMIVAQMIFSSVAKANPNRDEMEMIKSAVASAWRRAGKKATIDMVQECLLRYPEFETDDRLKEKGLAGIEELRTLAQKLALGLRDYVSTGAYGVYFNEVPEGWEVFDISNEDFVTLELENLAAKPALFKVATFYFIYAMTQDLYLGDRSMPTIMLFDEAHELLEQGETQASPLLGQLIAKAYRKARKNRGAMGIVTHSALDLGELFGDAGTVINGQAAFKFFLESDTHETAIEKGYIPVKGFEATLLKGVMKADNRYSEVYVKTAQGSGVMRVMMDKEFTYWLLTTDPDEWVEIENLVKSGKTYHEAMIEMGLRNNRKEYDERVGVLECEAARIATQLSNLKRGA